MQTPWPATIPDGESLEEVLSRPDPALAADLAASAGRHPGAGRRRQDPPDALPPGEERGPSPPRHRRRPVCAVLAAVVTLMPVMAIPAGNRAVKRALGVFRRIRAA